MLLLICYPPAPNGLSVQNAVASTPSLAETDRVWGNPTAITPRTPEGSNDPKPRDISGMPSRLGRLLGTGPGGAGRETLGHIGIV